MYIYHFINILKIEYPNLNIKFIEFKAMKRLYTNKYLNLKIIIKNKRTFFY